MWILLRVLFAVGAAIARSCWPRVHQPEKRGRSSIGSWFVRYSRNKHRITGTFYGIALKKGFYFKLTEEGGTDRFFKWLGFSSEMQTEDEEFDRHIYVACDHRELPQFLKQDVAARKAVCRLFRRGIHSISTDGSYLWVYQKGSIVPNEEDLEDLSTLGKLLKKVPDSALQFLQDPFFHKAFIAESLTWGIALYGAPGLIELSLLPHPLYLSWMPVLGMGLLLSAVLFLLLMLFLALFLGGSSRTHRIIVESALLLLIGLPWTGAELVSDANIAFDNRPAEIRHARITEKYTRITRGRRGSRKVSYYFRLEFEAEASKVRIPEQMVVGRGLYNEGGEGKAVEIHIRPGRFNFPWMEQIRVL
ncbi:MAG: hypothetical protein SFU85_02670 [Candidatus Methylacidiphilales bacterium]|nr:hypothetical protein [Candidatus Methylacidiphilales bacterium]